MVVTNYLKRVAGRSNGRALDKNALAEIYDQFYAPIYRYIFRQIGEMDYSRELSAEVFHRLLKAIHDDPTIEERIAPWLYRTAHNLVVDHFRRQQHRNHLPLEEDLLPAANSTAEDAEERITAGQVRQALQLLSEDQRQVILMKFAEGLTNREVADAIGKSEGAVKALQHRALTALKQKLVENEVEVCI